MATSATVASRVFRSIVWWVSVRISHLLFDGGTVGAGDDRGLCAESHETCDFGHIAANEIATEVPLERRRLDLERCRRPGDALLALQHQQRPCHGLARAADQVGEFLVRGARFEDDAGAV